MALNIDVHSHFLPKQALGILGTDGPEVLRNPDGSITLRLGQTKAGPLLGEFYDLEKRAKALDAMGIDMQVLSITHHLFHYKGSVAEAVKLSKAQNDGLAAAVKGQEDRFVCNATLPLQDVGEAVKELERAYNECEARGIEIGSNIAGKNLDSKELWPFYEKAQDLEMPILVHPSDPLGAERMQKYYLWNLVGFPAETSIAIGSVIYGGVLKAFPRLKFIFCHGGALFPYQLGRLQRGFEVRKECREVVNEPVGEYFSKLYFYTILFYAPSLRYLVDQVGAGRVVLGTDYPFNVGDWEPKKSLGELSTLSEASRELISGGNAKTLFKL